MPYLIRKRGPRRFDIVSKTTGRKVGSSKTRTAAEKSVQIRNAVDHGWKPSK